MNSSTCAAAIAELEADLRSATRELDTRWTLRDLKLMAATGRIIVANADDANAAKALSQLIDLEV